MHLLFVNYTDFAGPSGIHIFHLANALFDLKITSTVLVPKKAASISIFGDPKFDVVSFNEARKKLGHQKPQLIHAWTPRESTRWMTERLSRLLGIPYIVHLEDNEEAILVSYFDTPFKVLKLWRKLKISIMLKYKPLPHPKRYKRFIANASGATLIIDRLKTLVPSHMPMTVIWPACEEGVFSMPPEPDMCIRDKLGVSHQDIVLTYPGNVHQANVQDVETLYKAVQLCRKKGVKTSLIRIGQDHARFSTDFSSMVGDCILELGDLDPKEIPTYLRAADILVQPGRPNAFDEYRFPSKLPMFLASGRPVILANVNLAHYLTDGHNAIVLKGGTAEEMAEAIEKLARSPEKRVMIGKAGRGFARQHFSWSRTAKEVLAFYNSVLKKD